MKQNNEKDSPEVDNNVGVLEYLVVLEDFRGMGYGAALMEWALNKFTCLGVHF